MAAVASHQKRQELVSLNVPSNYCIVSDRLTTPKQVMTVHCSLLCLIQLMQDETYYYVEPGR